MLRQFQKALNLTTRIEWEMLRKRPEASVDVSGYACGAISKGIYEKYMGGE